MEKFKFKLQNVLDYRSDVEERIKREFAAALQNYIQQEKILNELINTKDQNLFKPKNFKTVVEYQNYTRFMEFLEQRIESQRENINRAKEKLNKKREELIKATKDKGIIEKLKEKAYDEFLFEEGKKEQKLNDDYALYSYIRHERG
ncbi:flagellar biosynthesis chaperone [Caloramator mitchellensis]|uniref:Flagellar FliJ protein n=1 Tax=Caloramator mitchellensis TaxID=908809 RepID=A0A0R3JU40_CALMK|nr:flagellar export protein FliJ [Caloramator mitchellensis]KRQ87056.1 flagellar biosynthesis chaperone [Caloramator mitchellensis]